MQTHNKKELQQPVTNGRDYNTISETELEPNGKLTQQLTIEEAYKAAGCGWYQVVLSFAVSVTMITCMQYVFSLPLLLRFPTVTGCHNTTADGVCRSSQEACTSGSPWHYVDNSQNFISEFNLLCDNYAPAALMAAFGIGSLLGNVVFSWLSDVFGRLPMLFVGQSSNVLGLLLIIILHNFKATLVLTVFLGFFLSGSGTPTFAFATDSVKKESMALYGTIVNVSFAIGEVLVAALMFMGIGWRTMLGLLILWSLFFYPTLIWLRESPRFWLSRKQPERALQSLRSIAKANCAILPPNLGLDCPTEQDQSASSWTDILALLIVRPTLLKLLMCMFLYFTCAFVYYGIAMNIQRFAGDPCVNALLSGLVEVAAAGLSGFMVRAWGSRSIFVASFALTAGSMLLQVLGPHNAILTTFCVSTGKFGISASFNVIYIIAGEVFPTAAKNSALGLCLIADRIGNILGAIAGFAPTLSLQILLLLYSYCCIRLLSAIADFSKGSTTQAWIPSSCEANSDARTIISFLRSWKLVRLSII